MDRIGRCPIRSTRYGIDRNLMAHTALVQQANESAVVIDGVLSRQLTPADFRQTGDDRLRVRWDDLAARLLQADRHLVRIKVWDRTGRIVYSNNPRQEGRRYP